MINGEVRPPATYLDAEEILRRQYVASLVDRLARDPSQRMPREGRGGHRVGGRGLVPARSGHRGGGTCQRTTSTTFLDCFDRSAMRPEVPASSGQRRSSRRRQRSTRGTTTSRAYSCNATLGDAELELAYRRQEILATIPALKAQPRGPPQRTPTSATSGPHVRPSSSWSGSGRPPHEARGSPHSRSTACCPTTRCSTTPSRSTSP